MLSRPTAYQQPGCTRWSTHCMAWWSRYWLYTSVTSDCQWSWRQDQWRRLARYCQSTDKSAQGIHQTNMSTRHPLSSTHQLTSRSLKLDSLYTRWSIKSCHFYFLNSFVKHLQIMIIFGMGHQNETWRKRLHFRPPHVLILMLSLHYFVK